MRTLIYLCFFAAGIASTMVANLAFKNIVSVPYTNSTVVRDGDELASALHSESSQSYRFPIIPQERLSFCGVASLANVLASFGINPPSQDAILKSESSTSDYWDVLFSGLTLDELAKLFEAQGFFKTSMVRPSSMEQMKVLMLQLDDSNKRMVVNFSRIPLFGENIGHHTPVGGYNDDTGDVLLLDVTKGYGNYLVKLETLYVAIQTNDSETGLQRGVLIVERI